MPGRIVVVGLGPGGTEHVTTETLRAVESIPQRFLRTSVHPTAGLVPGARSFDDVYEHAETFDEVYGTIVDRLVGAARHDGEILYAVPGSPLVLERTVTLLLERARAEAGLAVEVLPAMSFLDLAWTRLGVDPVDAGVRLVDGHRFAVEAAGERGPLLVAHTHADWVLSDIKLAVEDARGDEPVTILRRLGTPEEEIVETVWSDLDRTVPADHLTSLWIPALAAPVGAEYVRFHQLTRTLRERCPWDVEQTHRSLVPHLLEETYEVVDAIDGLDPDDPTSDDHLVEELGDLLYQIEFHATIAEQEGRFTIADVARGIHDKLVRRHPHVFGDAAVEGTDDVLTNWEEIKRAEKGRRSPFDGIPRSLPSLSYATKVGRKAAGAGFDWPDVVGAVAKIDEEAAELDEAMRADDLDRTAAELGDLLFAVVNVARHLGIDAEIALRAATDRFRTRFEAVADLAGRRGVELTRADLDVLDGLWDEVKAAEAGD